jgi:processive 1,2-diacylglycerol beta-glucosyltransferase
LRSSDPHDRSAPNAASPRRVLILSADVGEGHAAAARALRDQLERSGEPVEVTLIDGLAAMGPLLRSVVEDGYRTQLRVAPGSYSLYYWLLKHLPPMRAATKLMLTRLGAKSLRREIQEHAPDVVVSTYPAITVVLGYLRRRRLLDMPTVATITDMTGLFFWAQRGIDTHLVMYEASVRDVERIAGRGSAQIVTPLIAAEFLEPRERGAARDALGLPRGGHVVVVSGGGWGVGDIAGAVEELARIPDATIVCLAGHNDVVRDRLTAQFAASDRVRVLGFTDQMSELLAAADVLVHSTGGVTCLEAMARGCPVVSYGLPVGHAKLNTKRMAEHDLLALANSTEELVEQVERTRRESTPRRPAATVSAQIDAAAAVLRAPVRVRQLARWRMRATRTVTSIVLALGVGAWLMSTDELDAFASVLVGHPVRTVASLKAENAVAVIVRAPTDAVPTIIEELRHDGVTASFASTVAPSAATLASLHGAGDRSIPEISRSHVLGWIHTPALLRHDARALHLHHRFFYLAPANATVGQLLLAHIDDAAAVVGSVQLDSQTLPSSPPVMRAGDVVVVTLAGAAGSARVVGMVAAELNADGLSGVPFSPPTS